LLRQVQKLSLLRRLFQASFFHRFLVDFGSIFSRFLDVFLTKNCEKTCLKTCLFFDVFLQAFGGVHAFNCHNAWSLKMLILHVFLQCFLDVPFFRQS